MSNVGLGAVLSQPDENNVLRPWPMPQGSYPQETRYSVRESEALAIVWAIDKFSGDLRPRKFVVLTDHSSLQWLVKQDLPTKGRLLNWAYQILSNIGEA